MKKITLLVATLVACVLPMMSQSAAEPAAVDSVGVAEGSDYVLVADPVMLATIEDNAEQAAADSAAVAAEEPALAANDSVMPVADEVAPAADSTMLASDSTLLENDSTMLLAEDSAQFFGDDDDAIVLDYVPNKFADNWELSLAGGALFMFNGLGTRASTNHPFYDATGGIAEISASKWFNPYLGLRLAWTTGYLSFQKLDKETYPLGVWHNYVHADLLWDWTTQFGGYRPERIYDAVPYLHMGLVGNVANTVAVGGGLGFLNRFHINNNWLINLDVRATATSAHKFGVVLGMAIDVEALVGVTYRFDYAGWKKSVPNPYKATLEELRAANEELDQKRAQVEEKNELMADTIVQREQERKELAKLVKAITKDTAFYGVPDTMEMSVYYAINSSELSMHEKAHMDIYLRLISLNDPNYMHIYKVIGTADAGTGDRAVNERLCQRRAETIKNVLIENGIDPENITTDIEVVETGDAQMARASHVIIYPVEKPKVVIPDTVNLDTDDEEDENASK